MPSPPETDREYAYFCATGSFDPETITKLIELKPIDCHSTGDAFERNGHTFRRRKSMWKFESGLDDTCSLNEHISMLLRYLTPRKIGLLEASTMAKLQIVCVCHHYSNFSFALDFEQQKAATALGVGFWFDAYNYGDTHEEMLDLREQVTPRS